MRWWIISRRNFTWHVALTRTWISEPSLVVWLWGRVTTDSRPLLQLQQLAFSESCHFDLDIFPANTVIYVRLLHYCSRYWHSVGIFLQLGSMYLFIEMIQGCVGPQIGMNPKPKWGSLIWNNVDFLRRKHKRFWIFRSCHRGRVLFSTSEFNVIPNRGSPFLFGVHSNLGTNRCTSTATIVSCHCQLVWSNISTGSTVMGSGLSWWVPLLVQVQV